MSKPLFLRLEEKTTTDYPCATVIGKIGQIGLSRFSLESASLWFCVLCSETIIKTILIFSLWMKSNSEKHAYRQSVFNWQSPGWFCEYFHILCTSSSIWQVEMALVTNLQEQN